MMTCCCNFRGTGSAVGVPFSGDDHELESQAWNHRWLPNCRDDSPRPTSNAQSLGLRFFRRVMTPRSPRPRFTAFAIQTITSYSWKWPILAATLCRCTGILTRRSSREHPDRRISAAPVLPTAISSPPAVAMASTGTVPRHRRARRRSNVRPPIRKRRTGRSTTVSSRNISIASSSSGSTMMSPAQRRAWTLIWQSIGSCTKTTLSACSKRPFQLVTAVLL